MKKEHNERNAKLMVKYDASLELVKTVLGISDAEFYKARMESETRLMQVGHLRVEDLEDAISFAINEAHDMHEESWLNDEYTLDEEVCFMVSCEQQGVPPRMWYVLKLANHWSNDLAEWADNVRHFDVTEDKTYLPYLTVQEDQD